MSGSKKEHVKIILQTIENGTLSEAETEQRLLGLVRQEAERKDRPADLGLIRACLELGDQLQGRSGDVDSERIDKLKRRIAIAYEERKRKKEKRKAILKFASFGAAAVLLVASFFVPQHWSWIESWSTPDEQQRVLIGHEVTVDRVAKALADHAAVEQQTYAVNSSAEIDELFGFHSGVPQTLDDEWTLSRGYVDYMSGYIKLSLMYVSSTDPQKRISANMNLFTDIERAAFTFEQTNDGQMQRVNGLDIYVADNEGQTTAYWYNKNMYICLSGSASETEIINAILYMIGE